MVLVWLFKVGVTLMSFQAFDIFKPKILFHRPDLAYKSEPFPAVIKFSPKNL